MSENLPICFVASNFCNPHVLKYTPVAKVFAPYIWASFRSNTVVIIKNQETKALVKLRQPLIGITTYGKKETAEYSLPFQYIDCVRRAGGIPVLMPPGEKKIEELCQSLDGIILSGGGDIHQYRYGGKKHSLIYKVDEQRDETELALTRIILEEDIPTLAICRGMQILNVFLGGTLYSHIPENFGEEILHRLPLRKQIKHNVEISRKSKLYSIVAKSQIEIVSWHHQAVDKIPEELTITARSKDGVIEGLELDSHRWLVAVQWHPELSAGKDKLQQQLFNTLIEKSKKMP